MYINTYTHTHTYIYIYMFCLNGKFFDFRKNSFRYYGFSVAINVFLAVCA